MRTTGAVCLACILQVLMLDASLRAEPAAPAEQSEVAGDSVEPPENASTQRYDRERFAGVVPTGRNVSEVLDLALGAHDGGSVTLAMTNPTVAGASGLENSYRVESVALTGAGYGTLGAYSNGYPSLGTGMTTEFLETLTIDRGGRSAAFGRPDVFDATLRRGSNSLAFGAAWFETLGSLEGDRTPITLAPNAVNIVESARRDLSLTASGPIVRDRLFVFGGVNLVESDDELSLISGDPFASYDTDGDSTLENFAVGTTISGGALPSRLSRERSTLNAALTLSWFASPHHRLELIALADPSEGDVGPQRGEPYLRTLADAAGSTGGAGQAVGLDWGGARVGLRWTANWSPRSSTEFSVGRSTNELIETGPGVALRSIYDQVSNRLFGGVGIHDRQDETIDSLRLAATHVVGSVELGYGLELETRTWSNPIARSGDPYDVFIPNLVIGDTAGGGTDAGFGAACTTYLTSDPACYTRVTSTSGPALATSFSGVTVERASLTSLAAGSEVDSHSAFVTATWAPLPTVTLEAGVRATAAEITGAGPGALPFGELRHDSGTSVSAAVTSSVPGGSYSFDPELLPRLRVGWTPGGSGRHAVWASFGQYTDELPGVLAGVALSTEVGVASETFDDFALSTPSVNTTCPADTDGDGVFDLFVDCHAVSFQGLGSTASPVLDGSQYDPTSTLAARLGPYVPLVGPDETRLPLTSESIVGYAWTSDRGLSVEARLVSRRLERVLETVQFSSAEQIRNLSDGSGNPPEFGVPFVGHGSAAYGGTFLGNPGDNVSSQLFPDPTRDYDALELTVSRPFRRGWTTRASYRLGRLEGSYDGTFRYDQDAANPYVSTLYDLPIASAVDTDGDGVFDSLVPSELGAGAYGEGRLNHDRHHVFDGWVTRQFEFGLNLGMRVRWLSGTPRAPRLADPILYTGGGVIGFDPVHYFPSLIDTDGDGLADGTGFPSGVVPPSTGPSTTDFDGDGTPDTILLVRSGRLFDYTPVERDFLGENPSIATVDLHASWDVELTDRRSTLTVSLDVFNLADGDTAIATDTDLMSRQGIFNANYLKTRGRQSPRTVRLGARFDW